MAIFKGRTRVRYGYSRWGYTRNNGKGWHGGSDEEGLDSDTILMPDYMGKSISGRVITARKVDKSTGNKTWEWGWYVCVELDAGQTPDAENYLYFCHNARNLVSVGQRVKSGDALAVMGNTGNAALASPPFAHCHFEVRATTTGAGLDPTAYTGHPNAVGTYGAAINGTEDDDMKFLKVLSEKCEVFSAADVTAVDVGYNGGRLKVGEYYPVQAEVGSDGTYTWVRIQAGTAKRYAVVLPDRSEIVSLSAGDAITACMAQAGDGDTSELEAQVAQLTKERDAATQRADVSDKKLSDIKAYVAGVLHRLCSFISVYIFSLRRMFLCRLFFLSCLLQLSSRLWSSMLRPSFRCLRTNSTKPSERSWLRSSLRSLSASPPGQISLPLWGFPSPFTGWVLCSQGSSFPVVPTMQVTSSKGFRTPTSVKSFLRT